MTVAREYMVLHHRYTMGGGHWDLVESPAPYRSASTGAPHGEGSLCAALRQLDGEGWQPVLSLEHAQAQPGESFLLLSRG